MSLTSFQNDENRSRGKSTLYHPSRPRERWIVQTPYLPTASDQPRTPAHSLIRPGCLSGHHPSGVRLPPFLGPVLHPAELSNLRPVQGRQARLPRRGDGHPLIALEPVWTSYEEGWRNGRKQRLSLRTNTIRLTRRKILSTARRGDHFITTESKHLSRRTNPPSGLYEKINHPHSLLQVRNGIRSLLL